MNSALLSPPSPATKRSSVQRVDRRTADASSPSTYFVLHEPSRTEHEFAEIAQQYGPRMLNVAKRFLCCDEDAADAVQDALVSAFKALHKFEGGSELYTWLHRILVNACLMKLRSRPRHSAVSLDDLLPQFDGAGRHSVPVPAWNREVDDHIERNEVRALVRACIDQLPVDYRTIILLRDIEQIDTDRTAATLGVSCGAVKTRLHRARQALRTLLEPVLSGGESISDVHHRNRLIAEASN